jgi:hypothetical protein
MDIGIFAIASTLSLVSINSPLPTVPLLYHLKAIKTQFVEESVSKSPLKQPVAIVVNTPTPGHLLRSVAKVHLPDV